MDPNIDKLFERGKQEFFRYNRKRAAQEFRNSLSLEPNNPKIIGWLAITLSILGDYNEAESLIEKLKNCESEIFYLAKGTLAFFKDDNDREAIEYFTKAIVINPNNEYAYARRGYSYYRINKREEAILDFEKAISSHPTSYVYGLLGVVYKKLNEKQEALKNYHRAIKLDPDNPKAWENRGRLLWELGDLPGALEDYDKCINLKPEKAQVWCDRGLLRKLLNDISGALVDYDYAIKLNPENAWVWYRRGELKNDHLNNLTGAMSDFNKAIQLDPEYAWSWVERGTLFEKMGDHQKALADYDTSIKLDPNIVWAFERRGSLYQEMNADQKAIEDYSKAIQLNPKNTWAYTRRSEIYFKTGNYQKAIENCNQALRIDNNYSYALGLRASSWISLGKYEFAIADRARCYEIDGKGKFEYDNPEGQEISDIIYSHFHENVKPGLVNNDEKFLEYWNCGLFWGEEHVQSYYQGKPTFGHHGKYGIGYLCLTDRFLRIISLGYLSKKYAKIFGLGMGKKVILAFLANFDFRSTENSDKFWVIPFKDINGLYKENDGFRLITPRESWLILNISPDDDEYVQTALELARTGNLRKMINYENLRINPKQTNTEDDIFEAIERLASLRDKGVLNEDEFEKKKMELLARL